jgi:hypothetical protein
MFNHLELVCGRNLEELREAGWKKCKIMQAELSGQFCWDLRRLECQQECRKEGQAHEVLEERKDCSGNWSRGHWCSTHTELSCLRVERG